MIGICIKYFHENYGGMLQAYATVSLLEKKGIDYELIRYQKNRTTKEKIKSLPRLLNGILLNDKKEILKKKIGKKKHPKFAKNDAIRLEAFRKFNETHFTKLSDEYIGYNNLCEGAKNYSAIVTGSDQLWSPAGLPTNFYNLMFVPDDIRKISFASSFGVSKIPWYQKKRTKEFLDRIEFVSMREKRGSEIVKELTGRDVPTVLDPVLMIDKNEWESLIPFKREFDEPYIFAYFLGSNPEHREAVQELAQKKGYKVITLRHLDQYVPADEDFGDEAVYDVAPDRFLNILRGASMVCTDSFHGTCFSIINQKPFIVFNRYSSEAKHSKNSRIDTLCEALGVSNRRYNSKNDIIEQAKRKIEYNEVSKKLERLKEYTNDYLDKAFEGVK